MKGMFGRAYYLRHSGHLRGYLMLDWSLNRFVA
jgi:hypothetical protein